MQDTHFRRLLHRFEYSWDGYRRVRKGVKKRLARRMQQTGCRHVEAYIGLVEKDMQERRRFECLMAVAISRFFRDRKLWEILRERILPRLADTTPREVRAWSAGCAAGEEAYSLKILWEELRRFHARVPDIRILATDMNPACLARAQSAVYPRSSVRDVPQEIRDTCFEAASGGKCALTPRMKEGIEWRVYDLVADPPGKSFDLILLRNNLLTYYADAVRIPAVSKIVASLAPGGFLIVGSHERLPVELEDLSPLEDSHMIFQKG